MRDCKGILDMKGTVLEEVIKQVGELCFASVNEGHDQGRRLRKEQLLAAQWGKRKELQISDLDTVMSEVSKAHRKRGG